MGLALGDHDGLDSMNGNEGRASELLGAVNHAVEPDESGPVRRLSEFARACWPIRHQVLPVAVSCAPTELASDKFRTHPAHNLLPWSGAHASGRLV